MKNLNYLVDLILYQILKIVLNINKTENIIKFKIKAGYYLELLTPETMKLLGSTKSKITKNKNGENVPYLEVTEVVLIHVMLLIVVINKIQESCIHLFLINRSVNY